MEKTDNVVSFPEKKITFNEFLTKFISDLQGMEVPPDEEIEKQALMAIAEGDHEKAKHLMEVMDRRNELGLKLIK